MIKIIIFITILLQLSIMANNTQNKKNHTSATLSNQEASYLFNAKFYNEALKKIDKKEYKFLTALSYFRIKNYEQALIYFNKIDLEKTPFIKDEVNYYKAYSLYNLEDYENSMKHLKMISNDFILDKQKDILFLKIISGDSHGELSVRVGASAHPQKLLKKYKDLKIKLSSDMDLAILIAKMGINDKKNAIKIIKKVLVKNPNRATIKEINKIIKEYKLEINLTIEEKVEKCSNLIKLHQNKSGNKCFEKFITTIPVKNNKTYCNAHYFNGSALKKRRKHSLAIKEFRKVIKTCKKYDRLDKANYLAGLSSLMRKNYADSISFFKTLYTKHPKSYLADDGINYIGFIYSKQKKYKLAEKTYLEQIKKFPNGDTTEEAVWKIAYNHYKQKKYKKYISFYNEVLKRNFVETKYYSKGRLKYWMAKIYEKKNTKFSNPKKAQEIYRDIILNNHNNFYAFLARMKLTPQPPKGGVISSKSPLGDLGATNSFITYLKDNKKLEKIQWLIKNGLNEFLIYELNSLNKKDKIFDKYKKEIAMFLIDAKIYHLPFWHNKINQKWVPYNISLEKNISYLKKLYPKAYFLYIKKFSKKAKISPYLALSIMREESYFHSSIESWANAYGLMQIIEPTAKQLAKNLKIKYKRESLFNPEYNIKLGTTYLGWSSKYFKNKIYHVIPSYNAGLGAVKKWKKLKFNKKKKDFDMFIEDIPYTETRHYTKRVLTTYFIYNKLYENKYINLK